MRLVETRIEHADGLVRLVGLVERSGSSFDVYFAFPEEFRPLLLDSADPFLPALLVPALETGEALEIAPPVSPLLLSHVGLVQDIFHSWFPDFHRVEVTARPRPPTTEERGPGVGAFFSGGVDSFFTLMRRNGGEVRPRVTHLLFLKGLEQPLDQSAGTDVVEQSLRTVARETGAVLVPGESNLRSHFTLNYELYYHGAALLAAVRALSRGLGTILVPSGSAYDELHPWGSHPLLDPLWSSERLQVVHDGAEAHRADKIAALARQPLALEHLRVCLKNGSGPFNCGRCQKCARTMVMLDLLGVLPQARMFPPRLPADLGAVLSRDHEHYRKQLVDLARRTGRADMSLFLERTYRGRRRRDALRTLLETTPLLSAALPWIRRTRAALRRDDSPR